MIQTLVWCFRRWAIHHLSSDEAVSTMREFLWESHLDLVDQFSPPDLREFAILWLSPDHIGDRIDVLDELNTFFIDIVSAFDQSLASESEAEQNELADFIDTNITEIFDQEMAEHEKYRIYPTLQESADSFSISKMYQIMESILNKFVRTAEQPQEPAPPAPQSQQQEPAKSVAAALNRRRTLKLRRNPETAKKTRKNHRSN